MLCVSLVTTVWSSRETGGLKLSMRMMAWPTDESDTHQQAGVQGARWRPHLQITWIKLLHSTVEKTNKERLLGEGKVHSYLLLQEQLLLTSNWGAQIKTLSNFFLFVIHLNVTCEVRVCRPQTAHGCISWKAGRLFVQSTTAHAEIIIKHSWILLGFVHFLFIYIQACASASLYSCSGVIHFRIIVNFSLKLKHFQL